jgi:transposase
MDYRISNISHGTASKLTDLERQFLSMRSSGSSIREIASKLKKSTHTICDWNKKYSTELLELRNKVFCELQQKIIDSKTSRMDFLKKELEKISEKLYETEIYASGFKNDYENVLKYYTKISDLLAACEIELLNVGINFKDNIEPESNISGDDDDSEPVAPVAGNSNAVAENQHEEIIDNKKDKKGKKQKCNDLQHDNVAQK